MSSRQWGRFTIASSLAALGLALFAANAGAATYRFDNFGGDGTWENGQNWVLSSTHGTVPPAADIAEVSSNFTANISSAQTVSEVFIAAPNNAASNTEGFATVNVLNGTNLTAASTNGVRIGRTLKSGSVAGASKGTVNQSGGTFTVPNGTNGLRLSQADSGTIVADSLYRITDGTVRGGTTNNTMTAPLQIGLRTNTFLTAEFNVVGSLVDGVRFEDVRPSGSTVNAGQAILHFTLDSGGVTPIIAEDELRFDGTGANVLQIDSIDYPPQADITLIVADRITATNSALEQFSGMPDGTPIVTTQGGYTYNWLLRYVDDNLDDNTTTVNGLNSSVKLQFVSAVPEPGTLAIVGLAGMMMLRRRARR